MMGGALETAYAALDAAATKDIIIGEAMRYIDLVSCWIIFVLSGMLLWTYSTGTKRQLMLALALLAAVVGAFVGAVVIWETGHRTFWAMLQRVGHAGVLLWMWDKRFGFAAQGHKLGAWLKSLPGRCAHYRQLVRVWWQA